MSGTFQHPCYASIQTIWPSWWLFHLVYVVSHAGLAGTPRLISDECDWWQLGHYTDDWVIACPFWRCVPYCRHELRLKIVDCKLRTKCLNYQFHVETFFRWMGYLVECGAGIRRSNATGTLVESNHCGSVTRTWWVEYILLLVQNYICSRTQIWKSWIKNPD